MKRIHILESQNILETIQNSAGTDFPYYYDEETGEEYEGSWNSMYAYPFGYWPTDYGEYNYMFCVGDAYSMHDNACGKAAKKYFINILDEEISEEANTLEDLLSDFVNDLKEYNYHYDEENDVYVSEDGSDEFDIDGKTDEIRDELYKIDYNYVKECVEYAVENLEYTSSEDIKEHMMESYGDDYDFTDKFNINYALQDIGSSFEEYFEKGHSEGRIWPRDWLITFYETEQPSPDRLEKILHDINDSEIGVSYEKLLEFMMIFEDWNNDGQITACTVSDYLQGNYGRNKDREEDDSEDEEEVQYARQGETKFVPHLASQDQKREFFKDFRDTRDRAVYAPRERAASSLARYHTMRYPYGESIDRRLNKIIKEEIDNVMDESDRYNKCGFEMLIGIPGSGKSTYLKRINNPNIEIVCPDDIRREICGNISDQSKNREVWEMAEMLIMKYLSRGKYVILDATNVNTRSRQQLLSRVKATNSGVKTYATMFDANPKVSKERIAMDINNKVDRSNVPPEVIDRMYNMYQDTVKIIDTEGFDKVYYA